MGFPNIGPGELILILIIALIVLGPGKLPDVAASLGRSIREFRKAATDVTEAGKLDAPATSPGASAAPTVRAAAPTEASTAQGGAPRTGPPPPPPDADQAPVRQDAGAPARDPNPS